MSRIIEPMQGTVLVKLADSEFGAVRTPGKAYDTITWGTVIAINKNDSDHEYLLNREAYWRPWKDEARLPFDKTLAHIEIKDILGTSYED